MTNVVDADELLRRIQRGRERAAEEELVWRERAQSMKTTDPDGAWEAAVRARAFEAVERVLEEIISPGTVPAEAEGVKQVT
ncbi:hypothetical protein AB0L75_13405 [Streptomyces sp. NPDC052101]|uniref:hypothetical protein n=1 Tax=Streptomyces sp. NPDC052101 TaxID=3155763 RepID=UPI00342EBD22